MKHFDNQNFDELLFNYFEGELNESEKAQLFNHMEKDPSLKVDFEAWDGSYLKDSEPIYPHMKELLVETGKSNVSKVLIGLGIIGFILLSYFTIDMISQDSISTVAKIDLPSTTVADLQPGTPNFIKETSENGNLEIEESQFNTNKKEKQNVAGKNSPRNEYAESGAGESSKAEILVQEITESDSQENGEVKPTNEQPTDGRALATAEVHQKPQIEIEASEKGLNTSEEGESIQMLESLSDTEEINLDKESEEADIDDPEKEEDNGFSMEMETKGASNGILPGGCVRDPSFVQQTSSPIFINPAFAGSVECSRLSLSYRNQYLSYDHSNVATYYLSYDQYAKGIRGGIGLVSYFQNGGKGATQSWYNGVIYSPKIHIGDKFLVEPAVQLGLYHKKLNADKLNEGNNVDPAYNYEYDQSLSASDNNYSADFFDVSAGLVVSNKRFFTGVSVDHLTQPAQEFTNGEKLPSRYIVQVGSTFRGQRGRKRQYGASPMMQLSYERYSDPKTRLMWSSTFYYKWMVCGIGFGNRDWLVGMIGAQAGKFRFGYSYDSTLQGISKGSGGSHELSVRYLFNCKGEEPVANTGNPFGMR